MKAIVYTRYGQPDVLRLEEVEKPVPKDDEVLIRVHAASVNSGDWDLLRGTPFLGRLFVSGLLRPKHRILGADVAGTIEAAGAKAQRFRPGDEVFGDLYKCGWGAFAEYVCAREDALTPKPAGLTFEEAAAVPQAAVMALQGLRDKGRVQAGQKVLVNGAGGGVGTFAVQMAKSFGAEVTGVDSAEKLDIMRSAGAERVVDYTREDFTLGEKRYDLILDTAAHRSVLDYRRALNPGGICVMIGGSIARFVQGMLLAPWVSMAGSWKIKILAVKPNQGMDYIVELLEAGKLKPVIDKRYPLSEVPEALRYIGEGHVKGKAVITM